MKIFVTSFLSRGATALLIVTGSLLFTAKVSGQATFTPGATYPAQPQGSANSPTATSSVYSSQGGITNNIQAMTFGEGFSFTTTGAGFGLVEFGYRGTNGGATIP